jgi:membrane protease YdiL (CAAX protease family)
VLLPLAALSFAASERRRAAAASSSDADSTPGISRTALYAQALVTHAVLFGAAVAAARVSGASLFGRMSIDVADVGAALLTLAAVVALGELSWRSRSPAERARLWVRQILPRTTGERRAWVVVSAGAALAEEVAYRGAFVVFGVAATGSMPIAIAASASAFAAVHAPQGLSGVGYVLVIAVLHHALAFFTGGLLLPIAVHFAYDVLAGLWLAKRHGI